jgi:hypothetical protein
VAQLGSAGKPGERFARSWFQRRNDGTRRAYEEERLSYYLRSFQRHPAMKYGEVRSVVARKRGVGDHAPERLADHELGQIRRKAAIDPWLERTYRTAFFDSCFTERDTDTRF